LIKLNAGHAQGFNCLMPQVFQLLAGINSSPEDPGTLMFAESSDTNDAQVERLFLYADIQSRFQPFNLIKIQLSKKSEGEVNIVRRNPANVRLCLFQPFLHFI